MEAYGKIDIYETLLHELGHANLLDHSHSSIVENGENVFDGSKNIMYFEHKYLNSITPRRINLLEYDIDGAQDVGSFSAAATIPTTCSVLADISIKDCPADNGSEPNLACDPNPDYIWESPDIWACKGSDPCSENTLAGIAEQSDHTIKVRLHNTGCADAPAAFGNLELYWTLQRSGETWNKHWINSLSNQQSGHPLGGQIGAQSTASISEGGSAIHNFLWQSADIPVYSDYTFALNNIPSSTQPIPVICLLARLSSPNNDPMYDEKLDIDVGENVYKNNNIATDNFTFIDMVGKNESDVYVMLAQNILNQNAQLNLQIRPVSSSGNNGISFSSIGEIELYSNNALWQKFQNANFAGSGFIKNTLKKILRITGINGASINNLAFTANEWKPMGLRFVVKNPALITQEMTFDFFVNHKATYTQNGTQRTQESSGGGIFRVKLYPSGAGARIDADKNNITLTTIPNPANETVSIFIDLPHQSVWNKAAVYDITGKQIATPLNGDYLEEGVHEVSLNTAAWSEGIYIFRFENQGKVLYQKIVVRH
ncbi:MAG: T9SS type A sorting domain-containing protein [Sphingobacteriales bacterium]|nr:T9SS type A sorting domain-containing protein [Sphingobacteriales bacterium]